MKPQNKEQWTEKMENMVEEQIETSTKIFQNLPEEALNFSGFGTWSAAACLDHLNSYSEYYLPRIKKVLSSQKPIDNSTFIKLSWIGSYFINMMRPNENRKKFKAMKKHFPNVLSTDPHQIVANFIYHLEEMLLILSKAKHIDLNRGSISSSISPMIKLRPCDTIEFLLVHNQRHIIQAKKQVKEYQNNLSIEK